MRRSLVSLPSYSIAPRMQGSGIGRELLRDEALGPAD
jgi:hypothetical protein